MRRVALLLVLVAAAAPAAERKPFVSAFTRLQVEGPFRVTVTTGRPLGARVDGDPAALDLVEVSQLGETLVVRRTPTHSDISAAAPVTVTLSTPSLTAAAVAGPGEVTVTGMKGDALTLSVAGTGALSVAGVDAGTVNALSIGAGRVTVTGRATVARLSVNGAGTITADALAADALTARLDGPGAITARARLTADVTDTGLGQVAVAGAAKCTVQAPAGGAVICGGAPPRR